MFFFNILINLVLYSPFLIIFLLCVPNNHLIFIKRLSLFLSCLFFFISLFFTWAYNISLFTSDSLWFKYYTTTNLSFLLNIQYIFCLDGFSILLINLTTLLIPICILVNIITINYRFKEYIILLFFLEFLLINTFSVLNLFFFYICFEAILIPMFIIIIVWGSRQRKIHAAFQFFLYTLFGSIFMFISFMFIYWHVGSVNYEVLFFTNFDILYQKFLWFAIFFAFAVKVPMIPVHIWLPEAHVEAPTAGSVLLAGILLKLGSYGMFRFLLPLFIYGTIYYLPLVYSLCLLGIIYGSLTTLQQIDFKKIIAYSSVVHMNFALLGLFSLNLEGIQGCFYLMLSHGIVSSALFLCVGCLYDRYHTRIIKYYGGLVFSMPMFSLFFLIFSLANIAFPGTSGFVSEFLVFLGIFQKNIIVGIFSVFSVILSAAYSIWLYNRLVFKNISKFLYKFRDLKKTERFIFYPLLFFVFFLGIFPKFFFNFTYLPVLNLVLLYA